MNTETESQQQEEIALIGRILAGERSKFDRLVETYQKRIYGTMFAMLGNRHDAEDATQDVFLTAFRKLAQFEQRASFYTWLYRIAFNLAIDRQRRMGRNSRRFVGEESIVLADKSEQTSFSPLSISISNETVDQQGSTWVQGAIWARNWRRLASLAAVLAILVGGSVLFVRTNMPFSLQLSDSRPAKPMIQEKASEDQAEDVLEEAVTLGRSLAKQEGSDMQIVTGTSQNRKSGAMKKNEEMSRGSEPARSDPLSRFIAPEQASLPAVDPPVALGVTNAPIKSEVEPRLKNLMAFINALPMTGFSQSQVPGSPDASASSDYFMLSPRDAAKVLDTSNLVRTEGIQQIEILIPKTRWEQGAKHLRQLGIPIAMEVPPDGAIDFDAIESKQQLGQQRDKTATVDTKELLADTSVYFDWEFKPAVEKPAKQESDRKAGENNDWIRVRFRVVP